VLGFSIGGFVAQEITLQAPDLGPALVLVGTGPARRPEHGDSHARSATDLRRHLQGAGGDLAEVHFTARKPSQAAGREFLKRFLRRTENRDPEVNEKVAPAQIEAIGKWGVQREGSYEYLKPSGSRRW